MRANDIMCIYAIVMREYKKWEIPNICVNIFKKYFIDLNEKKISLNTVTYFTSKQNTMTINKKKYAFKTKNETDREWEGKKSDTAKWKYMKWF